jgi:hypothetical protein
LILDVLSNFQIRPRNRPDPATDRLTLEIKDHAGKSIRKETYSGAEVLSQFKAMGTPTTRPDGRPTEDDMARLAWIEARLRQIVAATPPADTPATTMPSGH